MPSIRLLTHARYSQAAAWLICALVCLVRYEHALFGVLWGGLLMALNLSAMSYLVGRCHRGQKLGGLFIAGLGSKFVLLMTGVVGIMQGFDPDLVGFAVGLATFFAGIAGAMASVWCSGTEAAAAAPRPTA